MKKFVLSIFIVVSLYGATPVKVVKGDIFENMLWKTAYNDYSFNSDVLELLKTKKDKGIGIEVYFAYWCGDSEHNVPPFIKILDSIGSETFKIEYYTVGRKKKGEKFYVPKLKVERIPTFIFYENGEEIGRIVENPSDTLEEDFLKIIF